MYVCLPAAQWHACLLALVVMCVLVLSPDAADNLQKTHTLDTFTKDGHSGLALHFTHKDKNIGRQTDSHRQADKQTESHRHAVRQTAKTESHRQTNQDRITNIYRVRDERDRLSTHRDMHEQTGPLWPCMQQTQGSRQKLKDIPLQKLNIDSRLVN